jgi:hypothetical protein
MNMNQVAEYVETDPTGRYGRVSKETDSMFMDQNLVVTLGFLCWNSLQKFLEGER